MDRKIVVYTSYRAVSLRNVADDIRDAANALGYQAMSFYIHPMQVRLDRDVYRYIIVAPFNPTVANDWLLLYRDMKRKGFPVVLYSMIEGAPMFIREWHQRDLECYAVSNYVRKKLLQVGIRVIDVVYHGLLPDLVNRARGLQPVYRKQLQARYRGKILFIYNAMSHRRKGHPELAFVLKKVVEKTKEAMFIIHTDDTGSAFYIGIDNVVTTGSYGNMDRTAILAYQGAFDFLLFASLAEGFGLPIIEANAMGVPAIHLAYEPLTEISNPEANIMVPYTSITPVDFGDGILYDIHSYNPDDMVEAILDAIDMVKNRRSEYEDRKAKAMENTKRFNALELYKKLIEAPISYV